MTNFFDKWGLWLFGVFMLAVTFTVALKNGWDHPSVATGTVCATVWLAASSVQSYLARKINEKFSEK